MEPTWSRKALPGNSSRSSPLTWWAIADSSVRTRKAHSRASERCVCHLSILKSANTVVELSKRRETNSWLNSVASLTLFVPPWRFRPACEKASGIQRKINGSSFVSVSTSATSSSRTAISWETVSTSRRVLRDLPTQVVSVFPVRHEIKSATGWKSPSRIWARSRSRTSLGRCGRFGC